MRKNCVLSHQVPQFLQYKLQQNINNRSPRTIEDVKYYYSVDRRIIKTEERRQQNYNLVNNEQSSYMEELEIVLNPFRANASEMELDLLTDSGTNTLTPQQIQFKKFYLNRVPSIQIYAYAGLTPRKHLNLAISKIFGQNLYFYPTLQGRVAQRLLLISLKQLEIIKEKDLILSNRPFDTTKGHIQNHGLSVIALNSISNPNTFANSQTMFMGNISLTKLKEYEEKPHKIVLVTMTDNGGGGQPVSMANYIQIYNYCQKNKKLLWLDACRIFQNCLFIKGFQKQYQNYSIQQIASQIVSKADMVTISFKKMYAHSGGGIMINKSSQLLKSKFEEIDTKIKQFLTSDYGNGYNSYCGLTGQAMVEIISGLMCSVNEEIVGRRICQVGRVRQFLNSHYNLPIISGGHALYIQAEKVLENVPLDNCPAEYLNAIMMNSLRVRGCGLGYLVYGKRQNGRVIPSDDGSMDSLRLAIPREAYTTQKLISKLEKLGKAYKLGLFKNLKGGLIPLKYQANGFYHFGASYQIVDVEQFQSVIKKIKSIS